MPDSPQVAASTPDATAAVAQSRGGVGSHPQKQPERRFPGEDQIFDIGDGVTRAAHGRPHQRQPNEPVYRPLKIFSRDPSTSRLEGSIATVEVPYEPLAPGPIGRVFRVLDVPYRMVDLDEREVMLNDGVEPSQSDPRFHQQMVYAVCSTVYAAFRRALGRHISWGMAHKHPENEPCRLRIKPHAFEGANAYYDKHEGDLCFGYYRASETATGRTLPGGVVFTCLSHDIIAHEVTHALLDGLRSHFMIPSGPDVLAFHEAFADLVAVFQHFSYSEVLAAAIRESGGDLEAATLLTSIAQEFGASRGSEALRSAAELRKDLDDPQLYDPNETDPHKLGETLVRAVFEAFITVFKRKTAIYIRLATNGTGRLPPGDLPADLQAILARQASRLANQFLAICIRALDYCPPVAIDFGDYLRALITADYDLVPADPWAYREALIDAFRRRRIFPKGLANLSEDTLRWRPPQRSIPKLQKLSFAELKFAGDPGAPADYQELRRQAAELGQLFRNRENLAEFGMAWPTERGADGSRIDRPCIQSIRSSRRVGPDGQVIFDLVAEVSQRLVMQAAAGERHFYGGATVILGPSGEIRYVVGKSIRKEERLRDEVAFIEGPGSQYWRLERGVLHPEPNVFKLLHEKSPGA